MAQQKLYTEEQLRSLLDKMDIKDLYVGKLVYFIRKDGKVFTSQITSINAEGNVYVALRDYNNRQLGFEFNKGKTYFRSSNSNESELYVTYSKSDAAILKRKIVIDELQNLKTLLNESMKRVKEHREKNWNVLNTDDVNKWISEFEKNNQW